MGGRGRGEGEVLAGRRRGPLCGAGGARWDEVLRSAVESAVRWELWGRLEVWVLPGAPRIPSVIILE